MDKKKIPKIQKLIEVGENPFQFVEKEETILQGFDTKINKTIYLFQTDSGYWGYYDKETSQVIEIKNWKEKAAFIEDHYVKMSLYHRIIVEFKDSLNYSGWNAKTRKVVPSVADKAVIIVTDTTYKQILEQLNGRPAESYLKFEFITKKIGKRNSTYVNKVIWVS